MTDHVSTHQAEDDARNESILIYVNGKIVPKAQAMVSVYDSGFMLGDGVWEGLRLHKGKFAFLAEHLDRLYEGAKAIMLDIGMDRAALTDFSLSHVAARNELRALIAGLNLPGGIEMAA